jgi:hypothetical protein
VGKFVETAGANGVVTKAAEAGGISKWVGDGFGGVVAKTMSSGLQAGLMATANLALSSVSFAGGLEFDTAGFEGDGGDVCRRCHGQINLGG